MIRLMAARRRRDTLDGAAVSVVIALLFRERVCLTSMVKIFVTMWILWRPMIQTTTQ